MATVMGTSGEDDDLTGTTDNNYIVGLEDDDILIAGSGSRDTLTGGASADTFCGDDLDPGDEHCPGSSMPPYWTFFSYDRATGILSYDVDGTGMAEPVPIAKLPTGLTFTSKDIFIGELETLGFPSSTDISVTNF